MKTLKTLTLGVLAACLASGSAFAYTPTATVIHVAGSTAFRTATVLAEIETLWGQTNPGTTVSGTPTIYGAYITATKNVTSDSNGSILANGHIDGTSPVATIIIENNWTGSATGVVDLVTGASKTPFIDETNASVQSALSGSGAAITSPSLSSLGVQLTGSVLKSTGDTVQLAMSDAINTTVAKDVLTAKILNAPIGSYGTASALATGVQTTIDAGTSTYAAEEGHVGIVPFQWFLGNYASTSAPGYVPTNISEQLAAALFTVGYLPQGSFSGTNNGTTDITDTFYLAGRNEDSGTRIGAIAESNFGFGASASPIQYSFGDSTSSFTGSTSWTTATGTVTVTGVAKVPANTELNFEPQLYWAAAGHSGYNTGPTLQAILNIQGPFTSVTGGDSNTTKGYVLGYLGLSDGNNAIAATNAATPLTYNGVAFRNTNVANGSYTFWTYEHAYTTSTVESNSAYSATVNSIADNIAGNNANTSAGWGGGTADAYISSGALVHAETAEGVYTEGATGKSPGNAGLLDDGGINVSRGTEGTPVISIN